MDHAMKNADRQYDTTCRLSETDKAMMTSMSSCNRFGSSAVRTVQYFIAERFSRHGMHLGRLSKYRSISELFNDHSFLNSLNLLLSDIDPTGQQPGENESFLDTKRHVFHDGRKVKEDLHAKKDRILDSKGCFAKCQSNRTKILIATFFLERMNYSDPCLLSMAKIVFDL